MESSSDSENAAYHWPGAAAPLEDAKGSAFVVAVALQIAPLPRGVTDLAANPRFAARFDDANLAIGGRAAIGLGLLARRRLCASGVGVGIGICRLGRQRRGEEAGGEAYGHDLTH